LQDHLESIKEIEGDEEFKVQNKFEPIYIGLQDKIHSMPTVLFSRSGKFPAICHLYCHWPNTHPCVRHVPSDSQLDDPYIYYDDAYYYPTLFVCD
jgi:hypothetical protein